MTITNLPLEARPIVKFGYLEIKDNEDILTEITKWIKLAVSLDVYLAEYRRQAMKYGDINNMPYDAETQIIVAYDDSNKNETLIYLGNSKN